jgi:hypothetical protein
VNGNRVGTWKQVAMTSFKVLSQNFFGETEENEIN